MDDQKLLELLQRDDVTLELAHNLGRLMGERNKAIKERDAALYDMHQLQGAICAYCKNLYRPNDALQVTCRVFGDGYGDSANSPLICGSFKWRGVCAENTEEENA